MVDWCLIRHGDIMYLARAVAPLLSVVCEFLVMGHGKDRKEILQFVVQIQTSPCVLYFIENNVLIVVNALHSICNPRLPMKWC